MYKLYTDKQEIFECDIQLEGASLNNSKARLVIETTDLSLLFKGNITSEGKCKIPVKRLKGLLGENSKGTIKLEVIAEDTYFIPWESNFEVDTAKKVQVEVKSQQGDILKEEKPGLWANIRAKRKSGRPMAKKGSKAYKASKKAGDEINKELYE